MSGIRGVWPDDGIAMRPFTQSLPMALLRAREASMRLFRPLLAAYDLTEQQWRVLRALATHQPLEVGELADQTFLLAPSLSRILTNLEARRLIQRRTVAHDQRRSSIELSDDGVALVRLIAPRSEAMYNVIEERFGTAELQELLDKLHELATLEVAAARDMNQEAS